MLGFGLNAKIYNIYNIINRMNAIFIKSIYICPYSFYTFEELKWDEVPFEIFIGLKPHAHLQI